MNTENARIVFRNIDGSCGVITPAPDALTFMSIEEIAKKDVPEGCNYRISTIDKLPANRLFRDAWTDENATDTVDIDMQKARAIHLCRLRVVRNAKLRALDLEYIKADEKSDTNKKTDIANLKQALRDLPETLDLSTAQTPEQLTAIMPEILNA